MPLAMILVLAQLMALHFHTRWCHDSRTDHQLQFSMEALEWELLHKPKSMSELDLSFLSLSTSLFLFSVIFLCFPLDVQVGTNGIISFGRPFYFWYPRNFPTPYPWIRDTFVAAPFWHDVDIQSKGHVIYATPTREESSQLYTTIDTFLVSVSEKALRCH